MDGVIFRGKNFWLDLHTVMNTRQIAIKMAEEYLIKDYELLSRLTVEWWSGMMAEPLFNLVRGREYTEGIFDLITYTRSENIKTAIISSGPWQLAQRAKAELCINRVFANQVHVDSGVFSGAVNVMVREDNKGDILEKLMFSAQMLPSEVAMIGDSDADAAMARMCGVSIAYNTKSDKLRSCCTHTLEDGHLKGAIEILKSAETKAN